MTYSAEQKPHQQIHDFIHRLKASYPKEKQSQEISINSFEKPLEEELLSLNGIIKTLAKKLELAQNEISLLQNEKSAISSQLTEQNQKNQLLLEEMTQLSKKSPTSLQEEIKPEEMTSIHSLELIERLQRETVALRAILHEKESIIQQSHESAFHQDSVLREKSAKMAITLKSIEEELHGAQCERNALQREIKHIGSKLKSAEEELSLLREEREQLIEKKKINEELLQRREEELTSEKTLRKELEHIVAAREIDLFEKNECLSKALERYQEVESLLAQKIEQEILLQEANCTLQDTKTSLESANNNLISKIEELEEQYMQIEQDRILTKKMVQERDDELQRVQEQLYKVDQEKRSCANLLESSLQAADLIKRAQEALLRAQSTYLLQSEIEKPSRIFEGEEEIRIEKNHGNSYNLF